MSKAFNVSKVTAGADIVKARVILLVKTVRRKPESILEINKD